MAKKKVDFSVRDEGSICILNLYSQAAQIWAEENLPEDRMTWCGGVVIEPRYVQAIVDGLLAEGFTC
jgi:hypothetical protein